MQSRIVKLSDMRVITFIELTKHNRLNLVFLIHKIYILNSLQLADWKTKRCTFGCLELLTLFVNLLLESLSISNLWSGTDKKTRKYINKTIEVLKIALNLIYSSYFHKCMCKCRHTKLTTETT